MKTLHFCLALVFLLLSGCGNSSAEQLREGDIIFQISRSNQSAAIQRASRSKYSHVGIIFLQGGVPFVYEAVGPVRYTPLEKWISQGDDGHYVVKRLRDADRVLTGEAVARLREAAKGFIGRPYDLTFEWSDDRIYCSELVWKIYDRGLGIRIGRLRKLRDFVLSDPIVKAKLRERYGDQIPLDETVISPGEMFSAEVLRVVVEG
jgi:hypothetical protein